MLKWVCCAPDVPQTHSSTRALDHKTLGFQRRHDALTVIALHLDRAVLDGAARAAGGFELLAQGGERNSRHNHPGMAQEFELAMSELL